MLRAYLADRDAPCPRCGYNLRAAAGDRCTECGLAIVLGIYAREPLLAWWLATLVPTGLAAGVGLLFAILICFDSGPPGRFGWVVVPSIAAIPAVGWLLGWRRSFIRLSTAAQRAAGVVAVLVAIAVFVGIALIR